MQDPNMGHYGTVTADKTSRYVGCIVFVLFFIIAKVVMK